MVVSLSTNEVAQADLRPSDGCRVPGGNGGDAMWTDLQTYSTLLVLSKTGCCSNQYQRTRIADSSQGTNYWNKNITQLLVSLDKDVIAIIGHGYSKKYRLPLDGLVDLISASTWWRFHYLEKYDGWGRNCSGRSKTSSKAQLREMSHP